MDYELSSSDSPYPKYYRMGVGLIVLNKQGQVFVGKRADMPKDAPEAWQMPQGGIDYGESPLVAAIREMSEEIGTDRVDLLAESLDWYLYDFPKELARTLWNGRYDGQRQKWFVFRFWGQDSDICIHTKNPEFSKWRWVSPVELPNLIVDFKRELYEQLLEDFAEFLTAAE